jgi:hypothetical protein
MHVTSSSPAGAAQGWLPGKRTGNDLEGVVSTHTGYAMTMDRARQRGYSVLPSLGANWIGTESSAARATVR